MKALLFFIPFFVCALPQGFQGLADVQRQGRSLEIQTNDPRTIVEWETFSIDAFETVSFLQPDSLSAVLNRILGQEATQIDGSLFSNGQVFLLNPNGILIGKEGTIDTSGFLATTLDVANDEFLTGNNLHFFGDSLATLVHCGTIDSADVFLMAKHVQNDGVIRAEQGTAALIAAQEVWLRPFEEQKIYVRPFVEVKKAIGTGVENSGKIIASQIEMKAEGNVYHFAIRGDGALDALGIEEKGGKVFLVAEGGTIALEGATTARISEKRGGIVEISGEQVGILEDGFIDVSGRENGGEILISSKRCPLERISSTFLGPDAKLLADGESGGAISLLSDDFAFFYGNACAQGKGSVEISAGDFDFQGNVWTGGGQLLFDPTDIDIDIDDAPTTPPSFAYPPSQTLFTRPGPTATLNVDELISQLDNGNNVTVNTVSGAGSAGRLRVVAPISWNGGTQLELIANERIVIRESVTDLSGGGIRAQAGDNIVFNPNMNEVFVTSQGGTVEMIAGNNLRMDGSTLGCEISVSNGSIILDVGNNLDLDAVNGFTRISGAEETDINATVGGHVFLTAGTLSGADSVVSTCTGSGGNVMFDIEGRVELTGGIASNAIAQIEAVGNLTMDIGESLIMLSGVGGRSIMGSCKGAAFIDVGTVAVSSASLTGNALSRSARIFALNNLSLTSSDAIILDFGDLQSGAETINLQTPNALSVSNGSDIIAKRDTNLTAGSISFDQSILRSQRGIGTVTTPTLDMVGSILNADGITFFSNPVISMNDSTMRIDRDAAIFNVNTMDLQNNSVFNASDTIELNANLLTVTDSVFRAQSDYQLNIPGSITLQNATLRNAKNSSMTTTSLVADQSVIRSEKNLTLNLSNLTLQNDSRVKGGRLNFIVTNNVAVAQSNIDGQNVDWNVTNQFNIQPGAVLEADDFDIIAGSVVLNNGTLRSLRRNIDITSTSLTMQNSALIDGINNLTINADTISMDQSSIDVAQVSRLNTTGLVSVINSSIVDSRVLDINSGTNFTVTDSTLLGEDIRLDVPGIFTLTNSSILSDSVVDISATTYSITGSRIEIESSVIQNP